MSYPDPWAGEPKRIVEPRALPPQAQMWGAAHIGPLAIYLDRSVADGGLAVEVECFACLDRITVPVEDA